MNYLNIRRIIRGQIIFCGQQLERRRVPPIVPSAGIPEQVLPQRDRPHAHHGRKGAPLLGPRREAHRGDIVGTGYKMLFKSNLK